jgi:Peptidase S46
MKNIGRYLATGTIILVLAFFAGADDGMWMPHQMKDLNLKAQGLQMNPDDLYKKDGTGKVPDNVKELWKARNFGPYMDAGLMDVPACFLNTTNVTGGNSGSPTFNARGEQIGIIVDMTYESVIGDYYIIPELQRSISVDIRYVLWVTDKFSGAKHIIKEMGL